MLLSISKRPWILPSTITHDMYQTCLELLNNISGHCQLKVHGEA